MTTAYQASIDKLISAAEKEAYRELAKLDRTSEPRQGADNLPYNHDFWSEFYHKAMNRLCRAAGLRNL